eukprot:TRINITY_DN37726_c0_g1_i1.p1 TRINITY_DN37726_c0_g1~~TRINITY_DN37726_c0_g1_i1.p1  ORF type:complete len:488 (-),score=101.15 TRINITY_DN37726_c0_g1_i1:55-1518(-)
MLSSVFGKSSESAKVQPVDESPSSGIFSGTAGAAGAVAKVAGDVAGVAASAVKDKVGGAAASASAVAATTVNAAASGAMRASGSAIETAGGLASMSKEKAQDVLRQLREYLEVFVKQKIHKATERVVDRLPRLTKYLLEDPQAPRCVNRGKDRAIDSFWPDIREEILWEVAVLLDAEPVVEETLPEGVDCFRAFWRYHLMAYDRSFWGNLRDPVFVIFNLLTVVPVYGVNPACYLFIFLIMDKTEEYQLISFILSFKGTQFISMGLLRAVTGYTMYMICVTAPAHESEHSCEDSGPGARGMMLAAGIGFLLQVALVWIAFALLRCAKEKGRSKLRGQLKEEAVAVRAKPGAYISYFLYYDLVWFLISLVIPAYTAYSRSRAGKFRITDWVFTQSVFAAQVVYGLLSVPFFLFTLPGLQRVLTHAVPTGYDRRGRARGFIRPPEMKREEPDRNAPLVSEGDAESALQKMREIGESQFAALGLFSSKST